MRLSSLRVTTLPGLDRPFTVGFQPGVNLLVGPNGSGKSSLTRAVFHLLWPDLGEISPFVVSADFIESGKSWQVTAPDSGNIKWRLEGDPVPAPGLPEKHVAPSYRLGLLEITPVDIGKDDRLLARKIRKEMDGGFDLGQTEEVLFSVAAQIGRSERKKLDTAVGEVRKLRDRYATLARRERTLGAREKEVELARQASERANLLKDILEKRSRQAELQEVQRQLAEFPSGVQTVAPDDPAELARWRGQESEATRNLESLQQQLTDLLTRQAELAWPETGKFNLELLERQIAQLGTLGDKRDDGRVKLNGLKKPAGESASEALAVDRETYNQLLNLHADLMELEARISFWKEQAASSKPTGLTGPRWALLLAGLAAMVGGGALVWNSGRMGDFHLPGLLVLVIGGLVTSWGAFLLGGRKTPEGPDSQALVADLTRQREDHLARLKKLAQDHHLDIGDPNLFHDLKQLDLRLGVQQDLLVQQGELDQLESDCAQSLLEINTHLALVEAGPARDKLEAVQILEDLKRRARELEKLAGEIKSTRIAERAAADKLGQANRQVEGIFRRLELDPGAAPDSAVSQLAELKPRWLESRESATRTEGAVRELERTITSRADLLDIKQAISTPTEELSVQAERYLELAGQLEALYSEVANLKSEIKAARGSASLEQATDHEDRCRQELSAKRDEARRAALGKLLLDQVRRQSESSSRPPVLAQAMELFKEFTGNRYELQVSGGQSEDQGRFRALDTESRLVLELSQLSDGTRAQLLLAVRLGFIFQSESEARPPLFLDDSLTSSDPERFAAVAASLGQLAGRQDRQIIYLTANPVDAAAWNRALEQAGLPSAHFIDLALERNLDHQAAAESLEIPAIPHIPSPKGLTPSEYGALLQVPRLDPWAPATRAHLFFLLTDQLELLRDLLVAGTPTVGRWLHGKDRSRESGIVTEAQAELVDLRCEIWAAVQAAWQVGRGKPVTMADLEASGQVTSTMSEGVAALLERCGQDGKRFMAALREGQVKRFQEAKKDQLQNYLELEGFLASRPTLDADEMVQQVVGDLSHRVTAGAVSPPEIRSLVLGLAVFLSTPTNNEL
jgi:exonuclease SbcC